MTGNAQAATAGIQWKGTDACLDIHCDCGEHTHFDGYFAYAIECGACGRKYDLPTSVEMVPHAGAHEPQVSTT